MAATRRIDLNSDVGEGFGAWPGGPDEDLMPLLTSVNIACGFHAGDPTILRRTCQLATQHECVIGAQVSYPDLAGFGRRFIDMQPDDLTNAVIYQLGALDAFARLEGSRVQYVKPHGALYNAIVQHEGQARAVVAAVREYDASLALMGLPTSAVQRACEQVGLRFVKEGFADRGYTADGVLVPRSAPGALLLEPADAAAQALRLAEAGVESICVHSDTPGAPTLLAAVAEALTAAGFGLHPFVS
ncbi:MAG: 5-oxoprolinase subunit PxpA [Ilumatobacteraceae bacterium]